MATFAVISRSEPTLQRSRGAAKVAFARRGAVSALARLRQEGCAKIRLPRVHDGAPPEAVVLNTAGGLTGGDRFDVEARIEAGAALTITTQAAERLYRAADGVAQIRNRLDVAPGGRAFWLPQETILFDGAALERRFEIALEGDAQMVAIEAWLIGRRAMGEEVRAARARDDWRVRIDGELVFADSLRLEGDVEALLDRPAIGRGGRCFASLLIAAADPRAARERLRAVMPASQLDGLVFARCFAPDAAALRQSLERALDALAPIVPGLRAPPAWRC